MTTSARLRRGAPAWGLPAAVGGTALAGVGAIGALDPALRGALLPTCPFRLLTGLDCPGCGGTRAVYALTQGDVALAADHNLLVVVLLPVLVTLWAVWLRSSLRGRPGLPGVAPRAATWLAVAVVGFAVARNLPWWPLSWLGSLPGG